jgi:phosphoglycerol transferase MdoB-like AlkP superfamily enzyme
VQDWSNSVNDGLLLLAIWLVLFILSGVLHSYLFAILCGLSMYPIMGVAHNFIHMRWHPFRYLWLLTGFTHQEW